ncbi:sensor histidine kinase [Nitrosomonas oligotropha]|uniref:Histidine kinase n=1 Tax=Nitrosomonas oligotropha TaxID=42354 RepID=A0A1H8TFK6_9PROT|nr:ATP-binding protein [Nitrosomonas oligotropha]SDX28206.1 Histidine kinase [Nitrosomonas oligotropha]SEO89615.1 Histidine kinase [Nitrosomonas oligotropha]
MFFTRDDRKISIIGGLLLLGLTLTTGITVYTAMRQEIESVLGRGLAVALQGKSFLLESQIEKALADARALSLRPFIVQSMQQLAVEPGNLNALHDLMRNVNSLPEAGFSAAIVRDIRGKTLSQVGELSKNKEALRLNKDTLLMWDKQFFLHTTNDVLDQDKQRIGSITTQVKLPQLTSRFIGLRSIGETGEFVLCAKPEEGKYEMACLISQINGVQFKHLLPNESAPSKFLTIYRKSGVAATKDYRQVPVIETFASLDSIGLNMILKLDEEELFKPVTEKLQDISIYLAALIIAEILLLNWFVRKLIKSEKEARKAKETAEQFSIELSRKESELRERLKEITCLYEIRRSIGLELSVEAVCQNIIKFLIPAMQHPEHTSITIELDGKRISSSLQAEDSTHELASDICINGENHGQLSVYYPENRPFLVIEEQRLINAITSDLALWLERKQVDELLHARLKEITCLYEIRRSMGTELSLEDVCFSIFKYLIPALQYPEIATAIIDVNGKNFTSLNEDSNQIDQLHSIKKIDTNDSNFEPHHQIDGNKSALQSKICVNGKECGHLIIFYSENKPFRLPEEQKLVNAIANDLGSWLELRRLEQALVSVAEEQAHTIGQELHDNVGQQIAAIGYQARVLEKKISASTIGNENLTTLAASIASQTQTAVIHIKQLAQGLLPFELEANGLIQALQTLATRISTTYNIDCNFSWNNISIINDNSVALNLYRITQEAVNNAIRHGKAQHITITLTSDEKTLRLSICDDGCGFTGIDINHPSTPGMGIKIMQYRAKQLGAKMEILARKEGGTEVRLKTQLTKNIDNESKSNAR